MISVTPAILPHSFNAILDKLSKIEGVCSRVQIDICDGVFGADTTWLPEGTEKLPSVFEYEFDIMVVNWKLYIPRCIDLGAKSIVAHVDTMTEEDMEYIANLCKEKDVALGISCSNTTTLDHHRTMVRIAKGLYTNVYIQVMGIAIIGIQGQPFDETVIARIVSLHKEFTDMLIQVDGSMNPKSTEKVLEAGATRVVVGSYIFDAPNVHNAYATILGDVMASLVELAVVHL